MTRDFPDDFLWGAATAAHQVEGHQPGNTWTVWEAAGRSKEPSGDAIDQWNLWPTDLDLLASLGLQAYRISVEWSRLEPTPGVYDDAAFAHYEAVLERMVELSLTAFVTLYHFTLPLWFPSWLEPEALGHWERFVSEVGRRLGHLIPFACTVNEPQIVASIGYLIGEHPPGIQDLEIAQTVNARLMEVHHIAVRALRSTSPTTKVGTCLQLPDITAVDGGSGLADQLRELAITSHLDDLRTEADPGDFVGLQYYSELRIGPEGIVRDYGDQETTQMGWVVHPEGFTRVLRLAASVGLPVYVTENGIATADDKQRISYLTRHLAALKQARDEGADVRGYLHWSAFDNFEWSEGYGPTFGLIHVDRATQTRTPKPSAYAFQRVIETGRIEAAFS